MFLRSTTENFISTNTNPAYDNIGQFLITMMQIVSFAALKIAKKYFEVNQGYLIKFPIGDWSGDGHEHCEWYTVRSNLTVEHLREIHFSAPEKIGFEIGNICHEYEEDAFTSNLLTFLIKNKIAQKIVAVLESNSLSPDLEYPDPSSMIITWLELLKFIEPEFEYSLELADSIPSIQFGGFDSNGRHLQNPGYGLFY